MNSSSEKITLRIKRSRFMKLAPVFLWLLAIFIPVMIGRNIYLATFQRQKEEMAATGRHQLMTRVRELEARLTPERIITRQLQLDACNLAYNQIIYTDDPSKLAPIPLVKALPNLSGNGKDLASFSSYLMHKHGIRPAFIVGLHPDPDRCGLFLGDGNELSPAKHALYLREFAEMCNFLNKRSTFFPDVPTEFNTFERFSFFSDYLGIFDHISTNFWRLHGSFSGRYRERLYVINMRPPLPKGDGHHILVGILTSQISPQFALTSASRELSDNDIKIAWGKSEIKELPFFYEEAGQLSMLMRLPETFRASLKRPEAADQTGNTAIRLSLNSGDLTKNFLKHASLINLALLIFLSLTLLTAIGTSLGQLKLRSNLSRLITAAFFVSMFLPLSGLAWLGASNARTSRETESEYIIKLTRQKLQQCETAFLLQRYRQQLLMFYISKVIANLSPGRWGEYTNRFFFNDKHSPFKAHFNNFYLYSAELDREYYRGQNPKERFRTNELPQVMSGAFRRALLQTGAFSHLSEKGRQKMSQLADFSSGIMDELVDDTFFNKVLSTPAELNNATLIARKDLLSVFFLRSPQKVVGMLCLMTNNIFPTLIIDELNARGSFKNKFNLLNHRVEIDFFSISEFYERRLRGRDSHYHGENPQVMSIDSADALYGNSDSNVINNLHVTPPHLLVTETMLDKSIFAVARITPPAKNDSERFGLILLAIIALTSCLALAIGISKLILLPVPPFLEALQEIESNRYDWTLNLQTGDEFDKLAASINEMKFSLLERRKMLQLVSHTAAEAARSGDETGNKPQKRSATILVSDIRGFTSISESNSAEEVVAMLNDYFTLMCPAIEENGGYIDKLIGDAIQAIFFAEEEQVRVLGAARAALEIRLRLVQFNSERAGRGSFTINNGIGIASGDVTTGLTGSKTGKLEAAVIGEPLQNAATLESYSKFASNSCIIIDENSYNSIRSRAVVKKITINETGQQKDVSLIELLEV